MTTDGGSAGTAGSGFRTDPTAPRPRNGDDPTEPGRRANTGRHRAPISAPRLTRHQVAGIAAGGLAVLTVTIGLAATYAPDATRPRAATLPTVAEHVREPSGHGGPLSPPSIAADLPVWEPSDGPVIVNQQPLPRPAAITRPVVAPAPVELPGLPPIPPAVEAAEPAPDPAPVVDVPAPLPPLDDVDDVTVPDPAPEPTDPDPQPEQPPAEPEPATEPEP